MKVLLRNSSSDDNDDDDDGGGLPLDHGHAPGEGNPPKLTKLTLAFYLGQLLPED